MRTDATERLGRGKLATPLLRPIQYHLDRPLSNRLIFHPTTTELGGAKDVGRLEKLVHLQLTEANTPCRQLILFRQVEGSSLFKYNE